MYVSFGRTQKRNSVFKLLKKSSLGVDVRATYYNISGFFQLDQTITTTNLHHTSNWIPPPLLRPWLERELSSSLWTGTPSGDKSTWVSVWLNSGSGTQRVVVVRKGFRFTPVGDEIQVRMMQRTEKHLVLLRVSYKKMCLTALYEVWVHLCSRITFLTGETVLHIAVSLAPHCRLQRCQSGDLLHPYHKQMLSHSLLLCCTHLRERHNSEKRSNKFFLKKKKRQQERERRHCNMQLTEVNHCVFIVWDTSIRAVLKLLQQFSQ